MLNWVKANRKALNAGKMRPERVEKFEKLLAMSEQYRRKNQYEELRRLCWRKPIKTEVEQKCENRADF